MKKLIIGFVILLIGLAGQAGADVIIITSGGSPAFLDASGNAILIDSSGTTVGHWAKDASGCVILYDSAGTQVVKECSNNTTFPGSVVITWITKTAAYSAVCGNHILADTHTTEAFTVTLPASPTQGCSIDVIDSYPYFSTNNLTIANNGLNIAGVAANLILSINNTYIRLIYINATYGWAIHGLQTMPAGINWSYGEVR